MAQTSGWEARELDVFSLLSVQGSCSEFPLHSINLTHLILMLGSPVQYTQAVLVSIKLKYIYAFIYHSYQYRYLPYALL